MIFVQTKMDNSEHSGECRHSLNTTTRTTDGGRSWQGQMTNMSDSLAYLFNNQLMSDVQFQFEEEEGKIQILYAHKLFLAMRSDVFDAMFNGPLKKNENPEIVKIGDIKYEHFYAFLWFVYTEEFHLSSVVKVQDIGNLLYAAEKYNIPGLMDKCREFIRANIRFDEIFAIKRVCALLYPELLPSCWDLVERQAAQIIQGEEFLSIDHDELCQFLKRDRLFVPELDLFAAIFKWAIERCEKKEKMKIREHMKKLRAVLGEAIFLIRFPTMTLSEFSIHVVPLKLLSTKEAHDVLQYLALETTRDSYGVKPPKTAFSCVKREK